MKRRNLIIASLLMAGVTAATAQTRLTNEHADIGVAFEEGAWNLHIHDETHDVEYSPPSGPNGAILEVGLLAGGTISADPRFGFLGPAGSPIWILPNTQNPLLLFLGFGAEELEPGQFVGDSITMALHSIIGPGSFTVFDFDTFGNPVPLLNSLDGLTAEDRVNLSVGAHNDLNWAFSAPGTYTVNFEASGTLADGNLFTASGPVAYTFEVVPEPNLLALLGIAFAGLTGVTAKRRFSRLRAFH